jgi:hypothetical protein
MVGEVLVERISPPLGMRRRVLGGREFPLGVVDVLVHRDAVVKSAVVEGQRNIVVDVEGSVGVVLTDAGQAEALPLVAHVHAVLRVIDGVQADHALVDVGAGLVHAVVVEPEEALLLTVVPTRRPVQVEVVHERLREVAVRLRPVPH